MLVTEMHLDTNKACVQAHMHAHAQMFQDRGQRHVFKCRILFVWLVLVGCLFVVLGVNSGLFAC